MHGILGRLTDLLFVHSIILPHPTSVCVCVCVGGGVTAHDVTMLNRVHKLVFKIFQLQNSWVYLYGLTYSNLGGASKFCQAPGK